MIARFLLCLRDDRRGMATVEFALLSVLFFGVMSAALDLGMWYQQRLRIDSAIEQGSMIAFNTRTTVDQAAIGTYVGAAAKLSTPPTVTVGCNGGTSNCVNTGRTCACVSGSTPTPTYTATACDAACADGSLAGYYMNIRVIATASTMVVPAAKLGGSMTQTRSAVVRLQ